MLANAQTHLANTLFAVTPYDLTDYGNIYNNTWDGSEVYEACIVLSQRRPTDFI
jgi:hypothetical protein